MFTGKVVSVAAQQRKSGSRYWLVTGGVVVLLGWTAFFTEVMPL